MYCCYRISLYDIFREIRLSEIFRKQKYKQFYENQRIFDIFVKNQISKKSQYLYKKNNKQFNKVSFRRMQYK